MTEQTQPTDAEIEAIWSAVSTSSIWPEYEDLLAFARAVLAKWGTPAGGGEPDNAFPLASKIYKRGDEWVLEVSGTINDCRFTCRHTQPGGLQPEDVAGLPTLYTTPQPTQAQAGAVPLTVEQLYEERQTAIPQLFDLAQQWADNKIHSYQFANEAEKIVDAVARRVESAHGITAHGVADMKGGQDVAE